MSGEINVTSAGEKNKGVVLNGKNAEVHFINAGKIITGNSVKGKEKSEFMLKENTIWAQHWCKYGSRFQQYWILC